MATYPYYYAYPGQTQRYYRPVQKPVNPYQKYPSPVMASPDMTKGNFSKKRNRCVHCNDKYRHKTKISSDVIGDVAEVGIGVILTALEIFVDN